MLKKSRAQKNAQKIYFVGIGGIGMSALARYFKAYGYEVSGSDSSASVITQSLRKEAIRVKIGHKTANISAGTAFVTYSRAIPADNPELGAARKLGVPVIPYAEVLGRLTEQLATIAITGSHGKSTTTALAGIMLAQAGLDPTVLVGTNLKEFGGKNLRVGGGPYLVLEADDYAAAFLAYSPLISIVTNIDREHMDFYKTFGNVKNTFLKFMQRTRDGGVLILNRDDAPLYSLRARITAIAKKKKLRVIWYSTRSTGGAGNAKKSTTAKIKSVLKIPGEHNLSNAMAVYELGQLLNIAPAKSFAALGSYQGAWRRMEYRGDMKIARAAAARIKIPVYDDYAHHPTEIVATLKGFKEKFPQRPLICIFQPHQAKRLQVLFKEFTAAFTAADALVLIPFYKVAGRDTADKRFTSETLAAAIAKKYPRQKIYFIANPKNIKTSLKKIIALFPASKAPVVVMMGAGDIVQYTNSLLRAD